MSALIIAQGGAEPYVGTTLVDDFIDLCSVLLLAQRVEAGLELLLGEDASALVELLKVLLDLGDLLRRPLSFSLAISFWSILAFLVRKF